MNAYILRQLLTSFGFFFVSLTGVLWLSQSLRSVDLIVNKGLSIGWFLYLTALLLPFLLTLVLPIALFAAVLYTYHRLSTESELMVMWAAGVSTRALARPALLLAAAVTIAGYALTLYLMPAGQRELRDLKTSLRSSMSHVLLQEGAFNALGNNLTVYVRTRRGGGELLGLLVHDNRNPDKPVTMMAESGALIRTDAGPRFLLVNGNRQEMERATGKLSTLYFDRYALDLGQFAPRQGRLWFEPKERFLHELIWLTDSRDDQAHRAKMYAEAHERVVTPLHAPVFTLVALAALLAGEFSRRGYLWRIAMAVAATILVRMADLGFANLAAKIPISTPLMYLNLIVPAAVCLLLLTGRLSFVARRLSMPAGAG